MEKVKSDKLEATSPPLYDSLDTSAQKPHRVAPPQAANGKSYFEKGTKPNIGFNFSPDPTKSYEKQLWYGRLKIKCDNIPEFMLEGLHWTTDNVLWEDGFIRDITSKFLHEKMHKALSREGHTKGRYYFLRDMQQEPLRWIGHLQVYAKTYKDVSDFRLEELSIRNVQSVDALGSSGEPVYRWRRQLPQDAFNAIYDNMPMDGWWPWPKRENI